MTSTSMRLITLVLALGWVAAAHGQSDEWHAASSILWFDDDDKRKINDSVAGIQFNVGRQWTEHLTFEGAFGYSDITGWDKNHGIPTPDERHIDLAANLLAFYDREARFAPYGLIGVGYLDVKYGAGTPIEQAEKPGPDGGSPTFTTGIGFKWKLGQSNFSMRGEYRLRFASEPTSLTDVIATIGVQYSFGAPAGDIGTPQSEKPDDTDGDGVLDMWDACPDTTPGVDVSSRGCEIQNIDRDNDNDRVPDHRDECPYTPIGVPVDPRGCSLDSDMDGVTTDKDHCPGSRIGADVDEFGCENDSDNDGVLDHHDRCPDTQRGARVDVYGCLISDVISLPGVNFESGSDLLIGGAENLMRDAAATLNKYPELQIEVAGHTDNVGNADLNLGLSDRRAKTVLDNLIRFGVDPARLSFRGYGDLQPIADNSTAQGRAINRRVELRVVNSE